MGATVAVPVNEEHRKILEAERASKSNTAEHKVKHDGHPVDSKVRKLIIIG